MKEAETVPLSVPSHDQCCTLWLEFTSFSAKACIRLMILKLSNIPPPNYCAFPSSSSYFVSFKYRICTNEIQHTWTNWNAASSPCTLILFEHFQLHVGHTPVCITTMFCVATVISSTEYAEQLCICTIVVQLLQLVAYFAHSMN